MNLVSTITVFLLYALPPGLLIAGGVIGFIYFAWAGLLVGLLLGLLSGCLLSHLGFILTRKINFLNQRMTFDSFNSFRD